MTTANQRYFTIDDIPDSPGKRVLLEILNSPKVDREKLRRDVKKYEKKRLAEWAADDKKIGVRK